MGSQRREKEQVERVGAHVLRTREGQEHARQAHEAAHVGRLQPTDAQASLCVPASHLQAQPATESSSG